MNAQPYRVSALQKFRTSTRAEDGVSIVEIVISVLLLGLLAVAFLPFLMTSFRISIDNVATVSATEVVTDHVESLRHHAQTCGTLQAKASELDGIFYTNQGHDITVLNEVIYCDASSGLAQVRFTASEASQTLLRLESTILIGAGT